MKRKLIFVCSPYRDNIYQNTLKAVNYCKYVTMNNHIPICPHIYFTQFLEDTNNIERKTGIEMGKQLLLLCDEVWLFGQRVSDGMKSELNFARKHNKPIFIK
jgi:hypothetical protein